MTTHHQRRRHAQIRITRDLVLFVVGVAGIIWSTVAEEVDRPYLLAVFAACVGLPVFLGSVPRRETPSESDEEDPT